MGSWKGKRGLEVLGDLSQAQVFFLYIIEAVRVTMPFHGGEAVNVDALHLPKNMEMKRLQRQMTD